MMKIKYDAQADILRIRLNDVEIEESEQVEPGVIVDYDAEGHIVGIEILDASEIVQPQVKARAETSSD